MTQTLERTALGTETKQSPVRIRKLGHVVFRVSNLEQSVKWYTEILNFRISDVNENGMVFLNTCGDHHTIALAQAPGGETAQHGDKTQLGIGHFAMEVASLDELFEIRDFLKQEGVTIVADGRRGPGCNTGVEFLDPDGYMVELYCNMDQIGPNNRSRPADQWRRAKSLEEARDNPVSATY